MTDPIQLYTQFSEWLNTSLGKYVLRSEETILKTIWEEISGNSLLLLGHHSQDSLIKSNLFKSSSTLDLHFQSTSSYSKHRDLLEITSTMSETFDAILLPHTLEFVENPYDILKQVITILRKDGYLIILGFNPYSLLGLFRLLSFGKKKMPYVLKYHSFFKIKKWLQEFGFEVNIKKSSFYLPPTEKTRLSTISHFLESIGPKLFPLFGNIYLLVAKRKTVCLTPLKLQWRPIFNWTKNLKPAPTEGSYRRE